MALGPTNNELVPRFQPSRFPDDTEEVGIDPAIGASRSRWGDKSENAAGGGHTGKHGPGARAVLTSDVSLSFH